jgi:hypothetical protein
MKIIQKGHMPDGTSLQIEDWSETYPGTFAKNATLAAYPIAKQTSPEFLFVDRGRPFRCAYDFETEAQCQEVFHALEAGADLLEYAKYLHYPNRAKLLG